VPRLVVFTGKGGVGTTTAAAATAALLAARGRKTLLVSTRPSDVFGVPLDGEPVEVAPGLGAMRLDGTFEARWPALREWLSALSGAPVELAAEDLAAPPGVADVLTLLELREQVEHGPWDVVLVDAPRTLLELPEALAFAIERTWPRHRRVVRAIGQPPSPVPDAAGRLHDALLAVRDLLAAGTVRVVLSPEASGVAEARRTLTALALHGYGVDALIANRVFPASAGASEWGAGWLAAQERALAGLSVLRATYRSAEPVGPDELLALGAELYAGVDPLGSAPPVPGPSVSRDGEEYVLRFDLPYVERGAVRLARSGDDLVLTVGGSRRRLPLPSGLRRCIATGASAGDGAVRVRFRPDPDLWPRGAAS
jgi:arsenite/tail-anchored protein-transporting ATPase